MVKEVVDKLLDIQPPGKGKRSSSSSTNASSTTATISNAALNGPNAATAVQLAIQKVDASVWQSPLAPTGGLEYANVAAQVAVQSIAPRTQYSSIDSSQLLAVVQSVLR